MSLKLQFFPTWNTIVINLGGNFTHALGDAFWQANQPFLKGYDTYVFNLALVQDLCEAELACLLELAGSLRKLGGSRFLLINVGQEFKEHLVDAGFEDRGEYYEEAQLLPKFLGLAMARRSELPHAHLPWNGENPAAFGARETTPVPQG